LPQLPEVELGEAVETLKPFAGSFLRNHREEYHELGLAGLLSKLTPQVGLGRDRAIAIDSYTKLKDLLMQARLSGWSFARLLARTRLGSQNRDANTLSRFDVVRIIQRRVKLMNLLHKLRRATSKFLHTNTEQRLPWHHANDAYRVLCLRSSISNR
jgi:hypothetical protein